MRILLVATTACLLAGCTSMETVRFQPTKQQQAMVRDGNPALVSRQPNSVVLVRPARREFASSGRPVFIVGINNLGRTPVDFLMSNVGASQTENGQEFALHVYTYEQLAQEERNRQIAAAVLTGLAVGANAYSASRAGYYNANSTVVTPRGGVYQVNTVGYSPTAAAIAQTNAAAQNEAMIASTIEQGQQNMAQLESAILKDNTLMPGEWYGGQLQLQPPQSPKAGPKVYSIVIQLGPDRHLITIEQAATR